MNTAKGANMNFLIFLIKLMIYLLMMETDDHGQKLLSSSILIKNSSSRRTLDLPLFQKTQRCYLSVTFFTTYSLAVKCNKQTT